MSTVALSGLAYLRVSLLWGGSFVSSPYRQPQAEGLVSFVNEPCVGLVLERVDLPKVILSSQPLLLSRPLLVRFGGDTTIRGNDGVGIENFNGGTVRSVSTNASFHRLHYCT